jgi:hypothetical protein
LLLPQRALLALMEMLVIMAELLMLVMLLLLMILGAKQQQQAGKCLLYAPLPGPCSGILNTRKRCANSQERDNGVAEVKEHSLTVEEEECRENKRMSRERKEEMRAPKKGYG